MSETMEPGTQPHVLLLATQPWPIGARLGLAMRAVGFRVSIWCPRSNISLLTDAIHLRQPYRLIDPMRFYGSGNPGHCAGLHSSL